MGSFHGKSFLVTGGAGFIGSQIVKKLVKKYPKSKILIFDNFRSKSFEEYSSSLGHFENIKNFDCELIIGDLSNKNDLLNLKDHKIDAIFHQGAISDTTFLDQEKIFKVNLASFNFFLDFAAEREIPLIYASSAAVYGSSKSPQKIGLENPINPYGFSKMMMDRLALSRMIDQKIIGLRYFNVYGPGEFFKGKSSSVALQIILQIIKKKSPVLFHGSENTFRDFVFIDDVVDANILALESEEGGIFNIGFGKARSFQSVFEIIAKEMQFDGEPRLVANNLKAYQKDTCADLSESSKHLNYKPAFNLEKGIKEYLMSIDEIIDYSVRYNNVFKFLDI